MDIGVIHIGLSRFIFPSLLDLLFEPELFFHALLPCFLVLVVNEHRSSGIFNLQDYQKDHASNHDLKYFKMEVLD